MLTYGALAPAMAKKNVVACGRAQDHGYEIWRLGPAGRRLRARPSRAQPRSLSEATHLNPERVICFGCTVVADMSGSGYQASGRH